MLTAEEADIRVARGMAKLDEVLGPDWESRVDLDRLKLNSCEDCTLGQLCDVPEDDDVGDAEDVYPRDAYERMLENRLRLTIFSDVPKVGDSYYGFTLTRDDVLDGDTADQWAILTNAWKRAITARLEAEKGVSPHG